MPNHKSPRRSIANEVEQANPKLKIGFVLTPRFTLTSFAGFIDSIRLASDDVDKSRQINCQWEILGNPNELVISSCGLQVKPGSAMTEPERFDYIAIVGGLLHGGQKVLPGTYSFLRLAARKRVPLIGLCTASFILARAGLMEGYEACVSWLHKDEYEREFPHLKVQSNQMFVVDGDRLTSAGGTSVVQLAAYVIEKHCGRAQALKSLRILIEDQPLPSGTWQPEAVLTKQAQDPLVRRAMLAIEQNYSDAEPITGIAEALGVSTRKLERHFLADVGLSPGDYRFRLRLTRAKWLVEHTNRSMTEIGYECGFNDGSYFSRAFKATFGILPTDARRQPLPKSTTR